MTEVAGGGGISIQNTVSGFDAMMKTSETDLAKAQEAAQSGNTADVMNLEAAMHDWSLKLQVKSNVMKAIADALRGIIRNLNG